MSMSHPYLVFFLIFEYPFLKMGKILKKGGKGIATSYMSRKQALKKLQLSLKDFRRLCILKGIYPVEPHHKKKANKNNSTNKTYYYVKDIQFLSHEPLINKFRGLKIFVKKLRKSIGKKDTDAANRLRENEPIFKLDHIVKERYPTFIDALRDIDDSLSMCFLFSTFPKGKTLKAELIQLCRRLTVEFMHFVAEKKALRKVFISIKGIYYQADIMGQAITWVVPHTFGYAQPSDVDFKIMVTFAQFYSTMLGFVNYKLYTSINLVYPPKLAVSDKTSEELLKGEEDGSEYIAAMNLPLKSSLENCIEEEVELDEFPELADSDEHRLEQKSRAEKLKKLQNLFSGYKVFLNREVPKESLSFIIRSFGGDVSFDKTLFVGATFDETDESITHQIIDRPLESLSKKYLNRYYVQPQWVYDCVNSGMLLPVERYFPGEILPPHLSPFVEEQDGDYVPPEKQALLDYQKGLTKILKRVEESSDESENDSAADISEDEADTQSAKNLAKIQVTAGKPLVEDISKTKQREAAEEKRLAIMAMPKKDRHLYNKIVFGQKRKRREVEKMQQKRESYEKNLKLQKKKKKTF